MSKRWLLIGVLVGTTVLPRHSAAQVSSPPPAAAEVDSALAAPPDTLATPPPAAVVAAPVATSKPPLRDRIYYGGSVVFTFGDVTRIGVYPMVAYKIRPKLSIGLEAGYEYVKYDDFDQSANNYGGSVFARYRLVPQLYAHAEYQLINYEIFTSPTTSTREWIPYLLVGGGLAKHMGQRTWAYVEVLFDLLQDEKSPYDDWEPFVSAGIGVGF
jgi:hypothetical protein